MHIRIIKHRSLLLYAWIEFLTIPCLIYLAYAAMEGLVLLDSKQLTLLELLLQTLNCIHCALICRMELLMKGSFRYFKALIVMASRVSSA